MATEPGSLLMQDKCPRNYSPVPSVPFENTNKAFLHHSSFKNSISLKPRLQKHGAHTLNTFASTHRHEALLSWFARANSPSYRPSLNPMFHTDSSSFRAGTLAPPVSGIHHCLQKWQEAQRRQELKSLDTLLSLTKIQSTDTYKSVNLSWLLVLKSMPAYCSSQLCASAHRHAKALLWNANQHFTGMRSRQAQSGCRQTSAAKARKEQIC